MSNSKFHGVQTSPTECTIHWTAGDCPTQDECRDYLNATGRGHLKPVLSFELGKVVTPFGKSIFCNKITQGIINGDNEIWKLGVTAVYEWWMYDRHAPIEEHLCNSVFPIPGYVCFFLYHTYDAPYCSLSPEYREEYPDLCAKEDAEWDATRLQILKILDAWNSETEKKKFFTKSIRENSEDIWEDTVPYEDDMSDEYNNEVYKKHIEKELEYESGNPTKC